MTNKPNTDKTIEQIRDELAERHRRYSIDALVLQYSVAPDDSFKSGFDAAIQLCEQRERDLVEALKNARIGLQSITDITFNTLCEEIDEAIEHRGENDSKD